ncbi:hypothetical protein XA68_17031 [Ophiocordyceps unilateralis]|uniref:BHLH domain-containing protein n=1 Tax=Ophiocordyceps unilateralis TaxID=268505 RepID=A0A2A9P4L2_OPHUN|nr:hypothetical protein XA68_17031 [Ophiocordyceps unilateralis]
MMARHAQHQTADEDMQDEGDEVLELPAPALTAPHDFSLPPPPTKSHRIIQIVPRRRPSSSSSPKPGEASGRKMARKTAHSLIERRRRSKMNDEFAELKSLIPACQGEMHKLAILQASIDYIRYLQDCIDRLKGFHYELRHQENYSNSSVTVAPPSPQTIHPFYPVLPSEVDVSNSGTPSPALVHGEEQEQDQHRSMLVSPSTDGRHGQLPPPLDPVRDGVYGYVGSASSACDGRDSPASDVFVTSRKLDPSVHLHHEATAALLMLGHDQRDKRACKRGLSVRDLLIT